MTRFQLRSLPGAEWPPLPKPEVSQLWAAYLELDRTQWLTPAEIEQLQMRQLRALLLHCFHEVKYYRRILSEAGYPKRPINSLADLRRLPLLTRQLYQTNTRELQAQRLPEGMTQSGEAYTSGTNGVPIRVLHTNRVGLWWNALFLRDLDWCGIDPRGRLAAIRFIAMSRDALPKALEGGPTHWNDTLDPLLQTGPAFAMDIRQDPQKQLAWLRRARPNYILSFPSNLEVLAALIEQSGEPLSDLRAIQAIGEPLPPDLRQRIECGFGVPIWNVYSTTEAGYIASPCPLGHGFHVHSENVIVEVLDERDEPCQPGETGRLVFTTLHNFLTPFVRYDILDDVTLGTGPCPCGRSLPLWTHVEGRRVPMFHLPGGGLKSSFGLLRSIRQVGGFRQFQIVQRAPTHFIVRIVPDQTFSSQHRDALRFAVQEEFESATRVDVEERPFLERASGGKLNIAVVEMERDGTVV